MDTINAKATKKDKSITSTNVSADKTGIVDTSRNYEQMMQSLSSYEPTLTSRRHTNEPMTSRREAQEPVNVTFHNDQSFVDPRRADSSEITGSEVDSHLN